MNLGGDGIGVENRLCRRTVVSVNTYSANGF